MKKTYRTLLPIIIFVFTYGCQNQIHHPIVVVDLEKVLTDTGQLKVIEEKTKVFIKTINTQLNQLKIDLNNRLGSEKATLGKKPSQKELEKLQVSSNTAKLQLQLEIAKAKQLITNKQSELIQNFRRYIKPTITQIAQQKEVDIVFFNRADMLYTQPKVDITNEVITKVRALPTDSNTP